MCVLYRLFCHINREMAPILDSDCLRLLFNPRYMDFTTCTSLRSVCSQFNFCASKYLLSVKDFDLSVLTKNFHDDSEALFDLYSCLLGTLTECCPNLEKIAGVRIQPQKFHLVSQGYLKELPSLASISVEDRHVTTTVLFNFLKPLHRLRSVDFEYLCINLNEEGEEIENAETPEEEKLAVQELRLKSYPFWRLFRLDSLKKLRLSYNRYFVEPEADFLDSLSRCQNIEQLEMEFYVGSFSDQFYSRLFHEVDDRPHLKQFTVHLHGNAGEVQRFMSSCPRMEAYVTRLTMSDTELQGWCYFVQFSTGKMRNLRCLSNVCRFTVIATNHV